MSNVTKWNLVLENVALGANGRKLKLFAPANQEHVSYSLVDFQKSAIEVEFPSVDLLTVMIKHKKEKVDLLKLDVEGSATVILKKAFTDGIYPTQILLEIDEVNYPCIRNFFRVIKLVYLLKENRYKFVQSIGHSEFCLMLS